MSTPEHLRLQEHHAEKKDWLRWGPYLAERQWGTVREDYSADGAAWSYFPHDHARSRVYRWGEDGLAGISDDRQRLCFALALWNGRDPILKERLFGLTNPEGNHGEDVKELYFYLDSTPTHSYMKHLYKYPQAAFPYEDLIRTNRVRGLDEPEYEIVDTGVFDGGRYWDVTTEYAKADAEDILVRITVHDRRTEGEAVELTLLPTLWYRNLWSFGLIDPAPVLRRINERTVGGEHPQLQDHYFYFQLPERLLFTDNETNRERIYGEPNASPFVKDAFHRAVTRNDFGWLEERSQGTKCSPLYRLQTRPGEQAEVRLRLSRKPVKTPLAKGFEAVFAARLQEADEFYQTLYPVNLDADTALIQRQGFAGMLWSKQYYNIDIPRWLHGDPGRPTPPEARLRGRNCHWMTLNNEDVVSMPDKWEYPWYASWDLAFHCVPLAMLDPEFAKAQLILFLREWYMHPNGQLPAYEWNFSDVNPPVHAWACLRVYRIEHDLTGRADVAFLKRAFQKLLINFTWWVNRKDHQGNNVFEGGFLGLDNIGVFDRSAVLPGGGYLEQADGTAWMGLYCLNMLQMALEIAQHDPTFEDVATKFFEHFVYIAESLNHIGGTRTGAWDEEEGFYFDILALPDGRHLPLKVRSLVGLACTFAVFVMPRHYLDCLPDFARRLRWFQRYRSGRGQFDLVSENAANGELLMSLVPRERLVRVLGAMLDEAEFLAPGGIRSMSKRHENAFSATIEGKTFSLTYDPGESCTKMYGGNSNWRGPIWMPVNYLLIRSLREYFRFYGDALTVEFPSGSGRKLALREVAEALTERIIGIFRRDADGRRPVNGHQPVFDEDPAFRDLILFYEYFHGNTSRGCGASHQTGWTGIVARLITESHYREADIRDDAPEVAEKARTEAEKPSA
jgi:hypothetical protein